MIKLMSPQMPTVSPQQTDDRIRPIFAPPPCVRTSTLGGVVGYGTRAIRCRAAADHHLAGNPKAPCFWDRSPSGPLARLQEPR